LESFGIKEDVDVLGESLNQVPAFGEARAAFKDDSVAATGDDAQGFGDIVVLLDDGRTQSARAKVLCSAQDGLLEIGMFEICRALNIGASAISNSACFNQLEPRFYTAQAAEPGQGNSTSGMVSPSDTDPMLASVDAR
jgi:hypothetical protein